MTIDTLAVRLPGLRVVHPVGEDRPAPVADADVPQRVGAGADGVEPMLSSSATVSCPYRYSAKTFFTPSSGESVHAARAE